MEVETLGLEHGHGKGRCDLKAYVDGEYGGCFATGGADGQITLHRMSTGSETQQETETEQDITPTQTGGQDATFDMSSAVTCLAVHGKELVAGFDDGSVQAFSLPTMEIQGYLTRFQAAPNALDFGCNGKMLACAGDEPGVRVLNRPPGKDKFVDLKHSDAEFGTRALAWDPTSTLLAVAALDGSLSVWHVSEDLDELTCERVHYDGLVMPQDRSLAGQVSWHPQGRSLLVPRNDSISILTRDTWELSHFVGSCDLHKGPYTAATYSPSGHFVASAGVDHRVVLWDADLRQELRLFEVQANTTILRLDWLHDREGTAEGDLALLTGLGMYAIMNNVMKDFVHGNSDIGLSDTANARPVEGSEKVGGNASRVASYIAAEAEESNDGTVISEAPSRRTAAVVVNDDHDDDGSNIDEAQGETGDSRGVAPSEVGGTASVLPPWTSEGAEARLLEAESLVKQDEFRPHELTIPLQDPFQSSSSPIGPRKRYLSWNGIGAVTMMEEDRNNIIEITFTDTGRGKRERFIDAWGFMFGALGQGGGIFASAEDDEVDELATGNEDDTTGRSVVYYLPASVSASGESWTKFLPRGEGALCVAAGDHWAAVATTRHRIRLFSSAGLQQSILCLSGPVVTMVGSGPLLAIVHHASNPFAHTQNLIYSVMDVAQRTMVAKGPLALTPGSSLTWLGFSEELMLCCVDSSGVLSGLTPSFGWHWQPMLDTKAVSGHRNRNKGDTYWPVAVIGGKFMCVVLKGGEQYPSVYPQPILTEVVLKAPVAQSYEQSAQDLLDAEYIPHEALLRQREQSIIEGIDELSGEVPALQAALDKAQLKAFQAHLLKGSKTRAADTAGRLTLRKSMQIAIKLADHHGYSDLASHLSDHAKALFEDDTQSNSRPAHMGQPPPPIAANGATRTGPIAEVLERAKALKRDRASCIKEENYPNTIDSATVNSPPSHRNREEQDDDMENSVPQNTTQSPTSGDLHPFERYKVPTSAGKSHVYGLEDGLLRIANSVGDKIVETDRPKKLVRR